MSKNKTVADPQAKEAVKSHSLRKNPIAGTWTKRDDRSGKFMTLPTDLKPFSGARKEKKA